MDVADSRGGRVPLAETLPLGFRGLWLRARGSVTFWAGLVVIAVLISSAIVAYRFELDGSLTALLLTLNAGIGYVLPVLALAAGWAGARARVDRLVGIVPRLRRMAADSWPLLAFTGVGYLAALTILLVQQGVPWSVFPGVLVLIGQFAMILAAIAAGQALGAVLPRVLVIFAAPAAIVTVTALMFAWLTTWNVAPWSFYQGIAYVVDTGPFVRIAAITAVIVAASVLVVCIRPLWGRALPVLALVGITIIGIQPLPYVEGPHVFAERSHSELVCSDVEPVICLWPEQEAAFGDSLRAEMADAYAAASALGLPVDNPASRSVAQYAMTAIPFRADDDWEDLGNMGLGTVGIGPDDLLGFYAYTFPSCCWEQPTSGDGDYMAVAYSVSILIGVPSTKAWPAMVDPYSGERQFDPSEIPDEAAARALVERWLSEGVDGVRKP